MVPAEETVRLYSGVLRFAAIVVVIHLIVFALVAALARSSTGPGLGDNTFRLAFSSLQVRTLDPVAIGDTSSLGIAAQVYEGLVSYNQETLEVEACLAERWEISTDGKVYTFHLRSGVRYCDDPCFPDGRGRELTAEDVRANFTRVCDPIALGTGSWLVADRVVGAGEYKASREGLLEENPRFWEIADDAGDVPDVRGFRAVDDRTFEIELVEPFAPFLKVLAMPYFMVAAPEAIRAYGPGHTPPGQDTFFKHPVGTGPFVLERWEPDVEILLRRNPHYWGRNEAGHRLPHVDAVTIFSRRDPHTAFMEFEEAHSDIAGVPDQDWDRVMNKDKTLKEPYASRYVLETAPTLSTSYYGFDMTSEPFGANKTLRQALNYAIDRESIVKTIQRGVGCPAYGPIPPGLPGYDPASRRYEYNPDRARELLAEAGYPNGEGLEELVLFVSGAGDAPDRVSVAVMDQLLQIGVRVRLKQQPWPLHLESIDRHEAKFFRLGWIADYPDAENFLALFLSTNYSPLGPNSTFYSSPAFDDLYHRAMLEPNDDARAAIYRQAAELITEEAPWLFTTYGETVSLRQPWVLGNPINALGVYYYKNVRLAGVPEAVSP